jgi:superfamily II DNA or RNA helicase
MAKAIHRSLLNDNLLKIIQQELIFQPTEKFQANKQAKHNITVEKDAIALWRADPNYVYVPYNFYNRLVSTQLIPIQSQIVNNYPLVDLKFTQELFDMQKPYYEAALAQLNLYGTTTLNVHTAFGKTVAGAKLAADCNLLTLVLYTNTTLEPQWKSTFDNFTNATCWVVGQEPPKAFHVILSMNTRIDKIPQHILNMVGTVIIDEAHTFCTKGRAPVLILTCPKYVIAMTATLIRNDGMIPLIQSVCGIHKIEKISRKPFRVYRYNTGITGDVVPSNYVEGNDWSKLVNSLCINEQRNQLILDTIKMNLTGDFKILVLTRRNKTHVIPLHELVKNAGIKVDYMSGNKRKYSDSQVLIGTIDKLGTGFDEKAACENFNGIRINLLLIVISIASVPLLEQVAGRAFRADFPNIIYFVDDNKTSIYHWELGVPWFKSRNGTIYEINSPYVQPKVSVNDLHAQMLKRFNNKS